MSSLDRQKEIGTTAASQAGEAHAGAASPDLPSTPTFLTEAIREPWRFDFFNMMRRLERTFVELPRIGESAAMREEYVTLGQDPFMDFPASNLSRVEPRDSGRIRVLAKFLGLLGPQGALPLATTEEAHTWWLARDDAFPRFLDLFNHRFLGLFYRAWADARPIVQRDRPESDRFITYIGAMIGVGSGPYRDLDSVPDAVKLSFSGLMSPQAKSASRLRALISGLFGVRAEVEQFVGNRLMIEPNDRSHLGAKNSVLGSDIVVGGAVYSIQDKVRVRIYTKNFADYTRFLPTGDRCAPLADAVFFYIGDQFEWEAELALPAGEAPPIRLGTSGQIGWTTWLSPNWTSTDPYRCDARFHPAERVHRRPN